MNLKSGFEERKARIEVIPLMDVMFLLLVFFIYTTLSMTRSRGVELELPQGGSPRVDQTPITISITAGNDYYLDATRMARDDLLVEVIRRWRDEPAWVLIKADRAASLGSGVEILSKLKGAGVQKIVFETRAEER